MSLYKHSGGSQFWWYKFTVDGKQYRKSTGTTDKREAEAIERQARAEVEALPQAVRQSPKHILGDCYELDEERVAAKGTREASRTDLRQHWRNILRFFGTDCPLEKVTYARMTEYVNHRRKTAKGQTIVREIWALKRGLELAQAHSWIPTVPVRIPAVTRDRIKDPKRVGKLHDEKVLQAFLRELPQEARDIFVFSLLTGTRLEEIRRVRPSSLIPAPPGSLVPAFLHVDGKSDLRDIALPAEAFAILQRLQAGRAASDDSPLFSQKSHVTAVRNATRRIGYDRNITVRDMRKTWATMTNRLSKDRQAIQAQLGHEVANTTDIYLEVAQFDRMAAAAATTAAWAKDVINVEPRFVRGRDHWTAVPTVPTPNGHSCEGTVGTLAEGKFENINHNTDLLVGAVGIEPTTYGLRVRPESQEKPSKADAYSHLAASRGISRHVVTSRPGHSQTYQGAQNTDIPWVEDIDFELVG